MLKNQVPVEIEDGSQDEMSGQRRSHDKPRGQESLGEKGSQDLASSLTPLKGPGSLVEDSYTHEDSNTDRRSHPRTAGMVI
jgi:hypothetical protein